LPSSRGRGLAKSAPLFSALGDESRLRIVSRLSRSGPLSITRLTAGSRISRQAIAKHLRTMERAGLARPTRRGRESLWRLEPGRIDEVRRRLEMLSRRWDNRLARLKTLVEE